MATADLTGHRPGSEAGQLGRDLLASDIDGRLVVRGPSASCSPRSPRTVWPVPRGRRRLPHGWPIAAAVAGWPVWWALGVTNLVFPVFAVPLAWELIRRRGGIRLPPGFWLWALFLLLVAVSGVALDVDAAGTVTSEGVGRYFAFTVRALNYVAVTVMLLYVGNMSEEALPRRRLINWIAGLAIATVVLGTLSVAFPDFSFTAPVAFIAPDALLDAAGGEVRLAQVQPILGEASPRPSAPFAYTNAWGNNLSLLLIWLVVSWVVLGSGLKRFAVYCLLAVALIPIVFSLNRAMWIGLSLAICVLSVRLALRGRIFVMSVVAVLVTLASLVLVLSPLQSMVQARLNTGHSNEVRTSLAASALAAATQSPVIGFGSTRQTVGSDASIAIGPSDDCPRCGGRDIGSTGQLTLVLIAQGLIGACLYFGFLLRSVGAYMKDHSVLGIAGTLVVGLESFYAFFYTALAMPLAITFLSIGLLWRNQQVRTAAAVT